MGVARVRVTSSSVAMPEEVSRSARTSAERLSVYGRARPKSHTLVRGWAWG